MDELSTDMVPMLCADLECGEAVLLWVKGERRVSLTIDFKTGEIVLLKSWGENIHTDMEVQIVQSGKELKEALEWMLDGPFKISP